jgi:hypothetical protein
MKTLRDPLQKAFSLHLEFQARLKMTQKKEVSLFSFYNIIEYYLMKRNCYSIPDFGSLKLSYVQPASIYLNSLLKDLDKDCTQTEKEDIAEADVGSSQVKR